MPEPYDNVFREELQSRIRQGAGFGARPMRAPGFRNYLETSSVECPEERFLMARSMRAREPRRYRVLD